MSDSFLALPGLYRLVFLHLEPILTIVPILSVWGYPGVNWFYQEQIPSSTLTSGPVDDRTRIIVAQLTNCYLLLGLLSSIVFREVRNTLPNNPAGQERLIGASLLALAIADITQLVTYLYLYHLPKSTVTHVCSVLATFIGLPAQLRYAPRDWNGMLHGNITITLLLFFTSLVLRFRPNSFLLWSKGR
ncbi:hypothetical protein Ac2012v2_000478 [Leucoagaricus gongylophorus]